MPIAFRVIAGVALSLFTFFLSSVESATLLVPEERTFNEAVAAAVDGDTVSVASGAHSVSPEARISVNNLIIAGRTGDPVDVSLEPADDGFGILSSRGTSGVRIEHLAFRGVLSPTTGAITARDCGDWRIENCSFTQNLGLQQGAVALLGSSAVVVGSTFAENLAAFSGGGGILFLDSGAGGNELTVERCRFEQNDAALGGALAVFALDAEKAAKGGPPPEPTRFSIHASTFADNTASIGTTGFGGGLLISGTALHPASGAIADCTITRCAAALMGGGIAVLRGLGDVTLRVEDTLFSDNIVGASHGGGIALVDHPSALPPVGNPFQARLTVGSCSILDNTAELNGGGIAVLPGEHSTSATIHSSTFELNTARHGGAIYLASQHSDFDLFQILDNLIANNENSSFDDAKGGGVYLVGTLAEVRGNNFVANYNRGAGGGLAMVGDGSAVSENRFGDGFRVGNDARRGGGVYLFFDMLFPNLRPKIVNNLFIDNLGFDQGAGIYVESEIADPQGFIGGNLFIENFGLEGARGEAAMFTGLIGEDLIFAHNSIIDHASGGVLPSEQKGGAPPIPSVLYLDNGAAPLLANNLIYNTNPTDIAGIFENGDLSPRVQSNVFFNSNPIYVDGGVTPLTLGELNDLAGAEGNLQTDPLLVPGGIYPFSRFRNPHLTEDSPLADAATDIFPSDEDLLADLPRDIDAILNPPGDPRIFGEASDIGADEIGPSSLHFDCDVVDGSNLGLNPRCDGFDLLVIIQNQQGQATGIDTDFDGADGNDYKDLFLFATGWYSAP